MAQSFKRYFVEIKQEDLFKQYGDLSVEELTSTLLEQHHKTRMREWEDCLHDADIQLLQDEIKNMGDKMLLLVTEAIPMCNKKSISRHNLSQALDTEVEHEKELVKETQKETQKETVCFDHMLIQERVHAWVTKSKPTSSLLTSFITQGTTKYMHPLNEAAQFTYFSDNLLVDDNYAQVCWLSRNFSEKMAYFHEHIMPYRQTMLSEFKSLQEAMASEKYDIELAAEKMTKETSVFRLFKSTSKKIQSIDDSQTYREEIDQDKIAFIKHAKDVMADLKQQDGKSSITASKSQTSGSSSED